MTHQLAADPSSLQWSVPQPPSRQSVPHTSVWTVPSGLKGLYPPFTLLFLTWKRKFKNDSKTFSTQNSKPIQFAVKYSLLTTSIQYCHMYVCPFVRVNDKTPVNSMYRLSVNILLSSTTHCSNLQLLQEKKRKGQLEVEVFYTPVFENHSQVYRNTSKLAKLTLASKNCTKAFDLYSLFVVAFLSDGGMIRSAWYSCD